MHVTVQGRNGVAESGKRSICKGKIFLCLPACSGAGNGVVMSGRGGIALWSAGLYFAEST